MHIIHNGIDGWLSKFGTGYIGSDRICVAILRVTGQACFLWGEQP